MDSRMTQDKILLDVGGTFIKCSDGREIPVDSAGTRDEISASLREAVADYKIVRAAVPGPFDYKSGRFLMKHKFAAVYGEYFKDITGAEDCRFVHDVNCMLLGEMASGNGRGYRRVAMIALGTGLGFSMSIDGNILRNDLGSPAVSIFSRPYRDGILEDYASKRGVGRLYGDSAVAVKEVALRAMSGDASAAGAFCKMGTVIGEVIAPILRDYDIECLLLGGQISRSACLFAPALAEALLEGGSNPDVKSISDFDNATFNGLEAL